MLVLFVNERGDWRVLLKITCVDCTSGIGPPNVFNSIFFIVKRTFFKTIFNRSDRLHNNNKT